MINKAWKIDSICVSAVCIRRPTDITIRVRDPILMPVLRQFVMDEELELEPSANGQRNEYWIKYPYKDFEQAKRRLESRITDAYEQLHDPEE